MTNWEKRFGAPERAPRMAAPYEIPDPLERAPWREREAERWFAENRTGRKCAAVIDEPRGCLCCVFHGTRWHRPLWGGEDVVWGGHAKVGTSGVLCSLAKNRIVTVIDKDDRDYRPDWCPLVPVEELPC